MPRSVPAYPQNAVVTHSPANAGSGDTSGAIDTGNSLFKLPPGFDVCAPVTGGTQNPFMAGLNTMGDGQNHTGVAGQTGNILSGLQQFTDALCGFALGGTSVSEVLEAARNLRRRGGNLHETVEAIRRLRDTVGAGTTPQSVLAGVEAVSGAANANPIIASTIAHGQATSGATGNQALDGLNGTQSYAGQSNLLLTGIAGTNPGVNDLLANSSTALNHNTANHAGHTSLSSAQSVALKQENLLVSQDFHSAYAVVGDTHWTWDGTDGSPSTNALGCAKVTCDGHQQPLVSSEIPVVAGENIEISAMVKWSGLTYTGAAPIVLSIEKYRLMKDPAGSGQNVYSDIGWRAVYTVPSPGTTSSLFAGTTSGWLGVSGTYEVEPNVDQLRFRLEVLPNATAGTVKWDDAEFLKLDLIADECVPGVGMTVDNIVTQLYGDQGSGFTHNKSAVALGNTASALVSVTARVAALEAEGHTGSIAGDDFAWGGDVAASPNWVGAYTYPPTQAPGIVGTYNANGVDAVWNFGGNPGLVSARYKWQGTDPTSTTDYQLVQLLLDSTVVAAGSGLLESDSWIYLIGRAALGLTSYVMAGISSGGQYVVGYQSGATFTTLRSGSCTVPGLGSMLSLYCGDKPSTALRHFRLEVGTTIIAEFDESGTGSPLGSSNRGYGWGADAANLLFIGQATPPEVNQWLAMDQ